MSLIDTAHRPQAGTGLALHRIPDALIPREPRLGIACNPVPAERLAALERSGAAVLGLGPGFAHVRGFADSVARELRALLRVPEGHCCRILALPPDAIAPLVAAVPLDAGAADLTGTSIPLRDGAFEAFDAAWLCPGPLLGTVPGSTVLVLSPRAAAAARNAPGGPFTLRTLLDAGGLEPSGADLMLLAHAVRSLAESEPEHYEAELDARLGRIAERCAGFDWVAEDPHRPGAALAAAVPTTLEPAAVRSIADFLERNAIAYGLADPDRPGAFRIGLHRWIGEDDLERLCGLLDHLCTGADR